MNSMFSSFDALCAEFLGQAVGSSFFASAAAARSAPRSAPSDERAAEGARKSREAKPPQAASGRRSVPRFAPELDGLNSFETLVSW
ncbi:hypothetical protein ACJRO7_019893 [Eucalyptus globulus]|uniref:Uncharacterized protein n=1 Tax=Eucalyptus globulus TaxID=34317 RepID=A0ABD3KJY2_EUCGL